jgi:two-component system, response regulator PdtaR
MSTRVLIADDETVQRRHLKNILTAKGYVVVAEAHDGLSAIAQARRTRPDVIILDRCMPGMDGITAAHAITQEQIAPVVLLSACEDRPPVEQAKEAGVITYLVKPLREIEVTLTLESTLACSHRLRSLEKEVHKLGAELAKRKSVERAKGILMDKYGITENEAYHKIQATAMNRRKSMRDVAEAILLADNLEARL